MRPGHVGHGFIPGDETSSSPSLFVVVETDRAQCPPTSDGAAARPGLFGDRKRPGGRSLTGEKVMPGRMPASPRV